MLNVHFCFCYYLALAALGFCSISLAESISNYTSLYYYTKNIMIALLFTIFSIYIY